jgi:RNA polymerase sigma-70 factor (ECF subfamily)
MGEWSKESSSGPAGIPAREPLSAAESEFARELFEHHRLALYRYLKGLLHSREEASEILQETYLRLLRQPSFDHVRANARAYLFQTATNLARDLFRHKSIRGVNAEMEAYASQGLQTPDWNSWPELALQGDQMASVVVQALEELKPQVREALLLYRFKEMSHQDIGAHMGLSTRSVERYVKEGLAHIGRRLKAKS